MVLVVKSTFVAVLICNDISIHIWIYGYKCCKRKNNSSLNMFVFHDDINSSIKNEFYLNLASWIWMQKDAQQA